MSKLTLIDGENVTSLDDRRREVRSLEKETRKPDPTDQEIIMFAHHYMRLGHPVLAQKQLNRLSSGYFDIMIYKDLFKSSLAWSLIQTGKVPEKGIAHVEYGYLQIVKTVLESFEELTFPEKPAFYRFRREFQRIGEGLLQGAF